MWEGLRKPTKLIVVVVTLLAYGCPLQAIVHAYGLDERTVASWRAGEIGQGFILTRHGGLKPHGCSGYGSARMLIPSLPVSA